MSNLHTAYVPRKLRVLLFAILFAAASGITAVVGLDTITIDPLLTSDAPADAVSSLESALPRAAAWLNSTHGEQVRLAFTGAESGANGNSGKPGIGYHLQVIVSGGNQSDLAIILTMKRGTDDQQQQSFPLLSRLGTSPELELAEIIWYEYTAFHGLPAAEGKPPELVETITPAMLSSADLPYPVELRPMSVAVLPKSHLVVGTTLVAVELDSFFREVSKPGKEIYTDRNIPYAYQVVASPAGTIVTYGTTGGEFFVLHEDGAKATSIKTGFNLPPATTILEDGSVVTVDSIGRHAVRIVGRRQEPIDIFPGPQIYVTSIAAGPDDTVWVWDPVEGRAHVFTAAGVKIGSFIPLLTTAQRRSIKIIRVLSDGSVLLLGNSDLWRTDHHGAPIWHLGGLPSPEKGDFTYINSIDVDESKSLIYLANQVAGKVYVLCDVAEAARRGSSDPFRDRLVELNRKLSANPDDLTALRDKAVLAESVHSYALAGVEWQNVLDAAPDDAAATQGLERSEVAVLSDRARQAATRALGILSSVGPESARASYQTAVQLYERSIARAPDKGSLQSELDRLKQKFSEAANGLKRPPAARVVSMNLEPVFPALIRYYQSHPVWSATVRNVGSVPLSNLVLQVSMRFLDYPASTVPVGTLAPGSEVKIPVPLALSQDVLNLQEDLPIQVSWKLTYDQGTSETVTGTASSTVHRNSALTWDNTAKFAAFITPNDEVISNFALIASDPGGLFPNWEVPGRFLRAAKILDTLGAMGMRYVEDPTSPISKVLGRPEAVDTVRFPRTTIRVRSGDCDDTTALLASCLEAGGVPTAIMTSPGHIFLAFNTGEPESYAWMYRSADFTVLTSGGTVWIPLESTVMSQGFAESWRIASGIVKRYFGTADLEFLPTATEQATYPPIPLAGIPIDVAVPTTAQVRVLFQSSENEVLNRLYKAQVESLTAQANSVGPGQERTAARADNRLGILHARFGETETAAAAFRRAISRDPTFYAAYLNLGQATLLAGDLGAAQKVLAAAAVMRPDDSLLLVLRSRLASREGDAKTANALLAEAVQKDPGVAAYGSPGATVERASNGANSPGGRGADASNGGTAIWANPDR